MLFSYPLLLLLMLLFPVEKCLVFLPFVLFWVFMSSVNICYVILKKKIKNPFPHRDLFGVLIKMWNFPSSLLHARFPSNMCIFSCQHPGLCICTLIYPAASSGIINVTNFALRKIYTYENCFLTKLLSIHRLLFLRRPLLRNVAKMGYLNVSGISLIWHGVTIPLN